MKQKKDISGRIFTNYVRFTKSKKNAWWDPLTNDHLTDVKIKQLLKTNSLLKLIQVKPMLIKWGSKNETSSPIRIALKEKGDKYWIGVFKDTHEGCILLIEPSEGGIIELFLSEKIHDNGFTLLQKLENGELSSEINSFRNAHQMEGL